MKLNKNTSNDFAFRKIALSRIKKLLQMAEMEDRMETSAFYNLISNVEVLETVDSNAVKILNEYNFISPFNVDVQIAKFDGNMEKIRKYIGKVKTCDIYYEENGELKNVDRNMFIELCQKLIDCIARELVCYQ